MSLTETPQPSRQAIQAKTASKPRKVTGALAIACKAIVWQGQELDQAAAEAGITTRTLRLALDRPHVRAFIKAERDVFRAYVSGQNIHHAAEIRNKSGNAMARLGAMKYIDGEQDQGLGSNGQRQSPGLTIIIEGAHHSRDVRVIDDKPLISLDPVRNGDDEGQR